MPEQVNPTNQTNPVSDNPKIKRSTNWKIIGIIAAIVVVVIGGLGYVVARQNNFSFNKGIKLDDLKNKIAFVRSAIAGQDEKTGTTFYDYDIYMINQDGSGLVKIIDNPFKNGENAVVSSLSWSPKGNYLAWIRSKSFEFAKSSSLGRTSVRTISPAYKDGAITGFAISPDEKRVALLESFNSSEISNTFTSVNVRVFSLNDAKELSQIKVKEGSGKADERVTVNNAWIAWLDSETIVTARFDSSKIFISSFSVDKGVSSELRIAEITGTSPILATHGTDIAYVKFVDLEGGGMELQLWSSRKDGSEARKVMTFRGLLGYTFKNISLLRFSPDGNYIGVDTSRSGYLGFNTEPSQFLLIDFKTGRNIFPSGVSATLSDVSWPPSGNRFVAIVGIGNKKISIIDTSGKFIKNLAEIDQSKKTFFNSPTWFPQ